LAAAVLIPWRAGCPHREAALAWATARYHDLGLPVFLAVHDGPWCKANGLRHVTATELLIADADVWVDPTDALASLSDHPWAIPHRKVHRLTPDATTGLLGGNPGPYDTDPVPYWTTIGGGVVAIRRDTYLEVPLDPRFVGWGGEDHAWGIALRHLAGEPWLGQADLLHLWHPPQPDAAPVRGPKAKVQVPIESNRKLHERYRHAKPSRARMAELVGEAREALWQRSTVS
jgi:hypothetical protein